MATEQSLEFLWKGHRKRIKRIIFFTYRFNFYWFHNYVLPHIHHTATVDCEVTIIASKFDQDDLPSFGDHYELSAWCGFKTRFKLLFLESQTVFHSKFIVCEYERVKELLIGIGSANLTKSGWARNLEAWNWNANGGQPILNDFLSFLSKAHLKKEFLGTWLKRLKKIKATNVFWLDGSQKTKEALRKRIWQNSVSTVGQVSTLRIVSPYFDEGSQPLLQEILNALKDSPRVCVEVVVDLSLSLANRKHLESALALRAVTDVKFYSIARNDLLPGHKMKEWAPLHLKLIELLRPDGSGATIYGSANFTGAAWMRGNHEIIGIEQIGLHHNSKTALPEDYRFEEIKISELKDIIAHAPSEEEDDTLSVSPAIFWACYSETSGLLEVRHSVRDSEITKVEWLASHNEMRDLATSSRSKRELQTLKRIEDDFLDLGAWSEWESKDQVLRWQRHEDRLDIVPEHLAIRITLKGGRFLTAPVVPIDPNFDERDAATGFPTDTRLDLDSLLGRGQPVVRPIKGRIIVSDVEENEDDESNNDESFSIPSLSTEDEYNHLPDAVKFSKAISKVKSEEDLLRIKKRLRSLIRRGSPSSELLLARSLLEVLDGEK